MHVRYRKAYRIGKKAFLYCGSRDYRIMYQIQKQRTKESGRRRSCIKERKGGSMKKKCFKKTVSWALSIVMSATMAVTPVLADTFTDGSQSIISENAEIPAVDVESATDCGDTVGGIRTVLRKN